MRFRPRQAVALTAMLVAATLVPTSPAQAATADHWGFAFVKDPTIPVWTVLDPGHQAGSWAPGPMADGLKIATGRFLVRFPNVGTGSRGNVHVTAVDDDGRFCETVRWYQSGTGEIVDVQCFKAGGAPVDTPFTVLWTTSSGILPIGPGSYASVQVTGGGIAQAYNSTGGAVAVTPGGTGVSLVRFGGVGLPGTLSGDVQVTAVQPNAQPRRCKVARWGTSGTDVLFYVTCFDPATGLPLDSDYTASYHRERSVIASYGPPKYFGYLANPGSGPTNYNNVLGVGANSTGPAGPVGLYAVKYPRLGVKETHSQVTAYGGGPAYCTLTRLWDIYGNDALVSISCFANSGVHLDSGYLSTFTSRI